MKYERVKNERLQAMLDAANERTRGEDCLNRLVNKQLANDLRLAHTRYILNAWLG